MKSLAVAALAVACLACIVHVAADAQEKAKPNPNDTVEVAQAILQEFEQSHRVGGTGISGEELYTWSRRLAEAEYGAAGDAAAQQAALASHADRMKELEARTQALFETGTLLRAKLLAAKYYRITADEWVKRGQVGS